MTVVTPYLQKLTSIERELPNIAKQAVINNKENIMNILKYSQLGQGFNSDGGDLKWSNGDGFYAPTTQGIANFSFDYSREYSKPSREPYNFVWSGNTFAFMDVKVEGKGEFDIFTTGGKQKLLESIYGEIFDLTDEHNQFVNMEIILPELQKYILDNLVKI